MKKIFFALLTLTFFQTPLFAETYTVQPKDSSVKWAATKLTGKHNGSIQVKSGTIELDGDKFTGGEATIDTTSLVVEDLTGESKGKLEGHLKTADFFDTGNYPDAVIKITSVTPAGGSLYDVAADLTIKNITQPINFQAKVEKENGSVNAHAELKIDRTKYDIRYGSGKFFENLGDKTIHDDFTLDISVKAS